MNNDILFSLKPWDSSALISLQSQLSLTGPGCRLPATTLLLANHCKVTAVEITWAWYKTQTLSPETVRKLLLAVLGPIICYGVSLNLGGDMHIRLSTDGQGQFALVKQKNGSGEE